VIPSANHFVTDQTSGTRNAHFIMGRLAKIVASREPLENYLTKLDNLSGKSIYGFRSRAKSG